MHYRFWNPQMRVIPTALLALFLFAQEATCACFLDIHLKSAHDQKATVVLSDGIDPTFLVLPIALEKEEEAQFGELLINFNKTYTMTVSLDGTEALGLSKSLYKGVLKPVCGTVAPTILNLPLTGIRLDFHCKQNWPSEKFDKLCDSDSNSESNLIHEVEFNVDYIINPEKQKNIVSMLKEKYEIANTLISEKLDGSGEQLD